MTDITGFTALGEHAEPEWLYHLINEVFAELVECLVAHGAHIDKYVGDEIMALFGVPLAQEHSVERAVRAALAMRERLQTLNRERRFGGTELGLHTGINVGPVMVGPVGHQSYADYTVIGDTVNVTKRLEDEAPAGEIYVSAAVRQAVRELFEFAPVGPLPVAGRRRRVEVFRVAGARGSARGQPAEDRAEARLVGREAPVEALCRSAEVAARGAQVAVHLVGPPGIGKSRVIREWRRAAELQGFRTVTAACHAFGEHFPFLPLAEIVAHLAGLRLEGWPPRVAGELGAALGGLGLGAVAREHLVALLVSLEAPAAEPRDGGREALCESVTGLLRAATGSGPLCVILEDVQWMDEASRSVLLEVTAPAQSWPLLLLTSAREPVVDWVEGGPRSQVVALEVLPQEAIEQLIAAWAAPDLLPAHVVQAICNRVQGHPYFARELVHSLRQAPLDSATSDVELPHTLQELFLAQLDRLPVTLRRLVQAASVLGEPLSSPLLQAAMGGEAPLTPALLAEATRRGLLRIGSATGQFVFGRRLLFEAAYGTVPPTQRRDMHARIATYIQEELGALGEAATHAAAHHAYLGYGDERALELLVRSARRYGAQYATRQAIRDARRAVELIGSLPEPQQFIEQRLEVLWLLAQSYQILGELDQAEGALAEAELLSEESANQELVGQIALSLATLRLMQGHWREAEERFARARDAWEQLGNEARVGHALLGMGMCARNAAQRAEALDLFTQAAAVGAAALWVEAAARNNAGVLLLEEGRYAEAESHLRRGLEANELDGDRRGVAHCKASLGELCYRRAQFTEAERWLEEALSEATEIEDAQCRVAATTYLARLRALCGRAGAAQEALQALGGHEEAADPESQMLRALAELEARLEAGCAAAPVSGEPLAPADQRVGACANAYTESLCVRLEWALRHRQGEATEEWAAELRRALPAAPDQHLQRYGVWLLGLAAPSDGAPSALPPADSGEHTVFDVRADLLWRALPTA